MPFQFHPLAIPEVVLVEPQMSRDERGFFMETYKYSEFASAGITEHFVQDNHSRSTKRVLRGLHYQRVPRAQGKLVRAVVGEIFDVAVDIRRDSPSFGEWVGLNLSAQTGHMVYMPPWCAHGFLVVSAAAEVVYKTTAEYTPELEGGVIWNDPDVGVTWPASDPLLSSRDQRWPALRDFGAANLPAVGAARRYGSR